MSACRACGAAIRWEKTATNDKAIPLDPAPTEDGNVVLRDGRAHVLGPLEKLAAVANDEDLFMPHHATCPRWHQ